MLRAVIFDFDGVITDSEVLHLRAFNKVLARYNIEIKEEIYYKEYLGFTDLDCFKSVVEKSKLGLDSEQIRNLIKQKNQVFEELARSEATIFEGAQEFLQMLRDNGIPMAICSGAVLEEIELILEQSGLGHFFDIIVAGDQITKGKPDPEGFILTLKRLRRRATVYGRENRCKPERINHRRFTTALCLTESTAFNIPSPLSFPLYYTGADDFKFNRVGFQVVLNLVNKCAIVNARVRLISLDCEDGLGGIVK